MWFTDPPQPAQQKPKINMGLSRKDLWKNLLPHGINSKTYIRRLTIFLRILYKQNQFGQAEPVRTDRTKKKFSTSRKQTDKTIQFQVHATLHEKIKTTSKVEPQT